VIVLPLAVGLHRYLELVQRPLGKLGLHCDRCGGSRLQGHGGYSRKAFVSGTEGSCEGLPMRRVRCVECGRAPSVVPALAASPLHAADAVVEDIASEYLHEADATYRSVAAGARERGRSLSHTTLHRWLTVLGTASVAPLLSLLVQLRPDVDPLPLLPKLVRAVGRKARSASRADILLSALQGLHAGRRCAEALLGGRAGARPPTLLVLLRGGHPT
jgi:hypothetical protein